MSMRILIASLAVCIAPAMAQVPPMSGLSCAASADAPTILAVEGVAELAADLIIKCQGGTPTPAGQMVPLLTLRAYVNVNLTSRLLSTSPDLSEALLLIDEPAPQFQLACPKLPCPITADSTSPYNGGPGHYNVFQATQLGGNFIEWAGVPIDPPGPGRVRTFRLTNVRVIPRNVNIGLGFQLVMFVSVTAPGPILIPITNPQQTLGFLSQGLRFTTTTAAIPSLIPHNADGPVTDFTMTFTEGFASAFKPRSAAIRPDDTSINANQNIPGNQFASASGFYNASFTGTYAGIGLATQGTRLIARFQNVPSGASLFVTRKPTKSSNTLLVQLVSTGPDGDGPYQPVQGAANAFAPITVLSNSAVAVWEVLAASPTSLESLEFGVAVVYAPNPAVGIPTTGTATVKGSFAPISRVEIASLTDPVPRFMENSARPVFTISDRGSPVINAVVNAANYAPGAPVAPGSVVAIFGNYLTMKSDISSSGPVAALGGTTVFINGIASHIYATTPGQVNVEIPWELAGLAEASLRVTVEGQGSTSTKISLADTAPYIFISGGAPLIARQIPVGPGSLLTIYGTGFGPVQHQPATGSPSLDFKSATVNTPTVTIGGVPAEVTFSGLAPGLVGVWQVSVKLPAGLTFGPSGLPVKLSFNGIDVNTTLKL